MALPKTPDGWEFISSAIDEHKGESVVHLEYRDKASARLVSLVVSVGTVDTLSSGTLGRALANMLRWQIERE